MIYADFKCNDCDVIFEVKKKSVMDNFSIKYCPECKSTNVRRVYSFGGYEVCSGKVGNYKNGYSNNVTYHPSDIGKMKGKKVK